MTTLLVLWFILETSASLDELASMRFNKLFIPQPAYSKTVLFAQSDCHKELLLVDGFAKNPKLANADKTFEMQCRYAKVSIAWCTCYSKHKSLFNLDVRTNDGELSMQDLVTLREKLDATLNKCFARIGSLVTPCGNIFRSILCA